MAFGGVQAVDGADLTAEPGAIVGLIGPNGSGKTTMLDVISGLVTPQAGSVRLDGESLVEYLPEERSSLGVVRSFQDCRLFPELSVEEVLWLTQDAKRPGGGPVFHLAHALGAPVRARQTKSGRRRDPLLRDRPLPTAPHRPALDRDPTGGGPGLDRAGPAPSPPARRAHGRDRPTRGRGLRPPAPPAARTGRHHHRAGRARRAAGLRPVLQGGDDGDGRGGIAGHPRRGGR